ncbi:hypothetical protein B0H11DRAFT_2183896 [Mycena galericulata]|nr:hypothetical protein B0H11DRAFT_2183896 [Mycena galericulata]
MTNLEGSAYAAANKWEGPRPMSGQVGYNGTQRRDDAQRGSILNAYATKVRYSDGVRVAHGERTANEQKASRERRNERAGRRIERAGRRIERAGWRIEQAGRHSERAWRRNEQEWRSRMQVVRKRARVVSSTARRNDRGGVGQATCIAHSVRGETGKLDKNWWKKLRSTSYRTRERRTDPQGCPGPEILSLVSKVFKIGRRVGQKPREASGKLGKGANPASLGRPIRGHKKVNEDGWKAVREPEGGISEKGARGGQQEQGRAAIWERRKREEARERSAHGPAGACAAAAMSGASRMRSSPERTPYMPVNLDFLRDGLSRRLSPIPRQPDPPEPQSTSLRTYSITERRQSRAGNARARRDAAKALFTRIRIPCHAYGAHRPPVPHHRPRNAISRPLFALSHQHLLHLPPPPHRILVFHVPLAPSSSPFPSGSRPVPPALPESSPYPRHPRPIPLP